MAAAAASGVLLLDKPEGLSSTQAMAKAKRLLALRKAGHTGTLDPFATGLLPLVFGEATKFSRFLIDSVKSYRATLRLGVTSSTGDTEGALSAPVPVDLSLERITAVLEGFRGEAVQVPPMHSAVRQGGRRLYQLAREGLEVERAARRIEVTALSIDRWEGETLVLSVTCSKGTYVRTLAADIGAALGCGAYLTALRRTAIGPLQVGQAVTLEELASEPPELARARLLPVDLLVAGLPRHDASAEEARRFAQGQVIACKAAEQGSEWAIHGPGGGFVGVGLAEAAGSLAPRRLMATTGPEVA
ncbi:MAG TPA: tRNA pseudouridine(55) synthase TruB [Usitatibacter sp.]|nr:tRNA pseudouridine(55) synthase TruB [Usitatibacter sp.]